MTVTALFSAPGESKAYGYRFYFALDAKVLKSSFRMYGSLSANTDSSIRLSDSAMRWGGIQRESHVPNQLCKTDLRKNSEFEKAEHTPRRCTTVRLPSDGVNSVRRTNSPASSTGETI